MTLEKLLCPTCASVSPAAGTSAQGTGFPRGGGLLPSPLSPACSASHHRESRKREQRGPCEHHRRPSAPSFPSPGTIHALTLNVCFLLMLSEGCTAATRKLRRGMLPRMLSSFSSGGQRQRLRVRRGLEPRFPPGRDPRAAAGTRAHRSLPVGEQAGRPPVGNRCLPVAPPAALRGSAGLAQQPAQLFMPALGCRCQG